MYLERCFDVAHRCPNRHYRQRWIDIAQRWKLRRWHTQRFNVDLTLSYVVTSYQPNSNVEATLKCLLGSYFVKPACLSFIQEIKRSMTMTIRYKYWHFVNDLYWKRTCLHTCNPIEIICIMNIFAVKYFFSQKKNNISSIR